MSGRVKRVSSNGVVRTCFVFRFWLVLGRFESRLLGLNCALNSSLSLSFLPTRFEPRLSITQEAKVSLFEFAPLGKIANQVNRLLI